MIRCRISTRSNHASSSPYHAHSLYSFSYFKIITRMSSSSLTDSLLSLMRFDIRKPWRLLCLREARITMKVSKARLVIFHILKETGCSEGIREGVNGQ